MQTQEWTKIVHNPSSTLNSRMRIMFNTPLLQILNPRLILYAFTLFSALLTPITKSIAILFLVVTSLAEIAFCAASTRVLFGTFIKTHLHHPRLRMTVNILLSISLVFTAISLTGII